MSAITQGLKAIAGCTACSLHRNQCPLLDLALAKRINVCWVGLSAKPDMGPRSRPLSEETRSGAIVADIERLFPWLKFYRTNLVKCPPLKEQTLRYPTRAEMLTCSLHLLTELRLLKPDLVILLGKQVIDFSSQMFGLEPQAFGPRFSYRVQSVKSADTRFVGVHHPSFINVYRRKRIDEYSRGVARAIARACEGAAALPLLDSPRQRS